MCLLVICCFCWSSPPHRITQIRVDPDLPEPGHVGEIIGDGNESDRGVGESALHSEADRSCKSYA